MYDYRDHVRSGPHSIHDARQHAWSLLVFGAGAPAPRQRIHPGRLPDVHLFVPVRRRSFRAFVSGLFRRTPKEDPAPRRDDTAAGTVPDSPRLLQQTLEKDRLAA